jgi:hypothetical protein
VSTRTDRRRTGRRGQTKRRAAGPRTDQVGQTQGTRTDRRWSEEDRIDKQTQETQTKTQTQMTYDRGYQAGGTLSHSVKIGE